VEMKYIHSEYLIEKPQYTSINQKKEEDKCNARKKAGLTDTLVDIKVTSKDPTLNYIQNPTVASKTLLDNQRKEEMLNELKKIEKNIGAYKDTK
jgi:hypothetical protein